MFFHGGESGQYASSKRIEDTPAKPEYKISEKFIRLRSRLEYLLNLHQRETWVPRTATSEEGFLVPKDHSSTFSIDTLREALENAGLEEFSQQELVEQRGQTEIRRDRGCFEGEGAFIGDLCGHNENSDGSISHGKYERSGDSITLKKTTDPESGIIETQSGIIDAEGHGRDASPKALLAKRFFDIFDAQYPNEIHSAMVALDTYLSTIPLNSEATELEYGYSFVRLRENASTQETELSFLQAEAGFLLILEEINPGEYHVSLFGNDLVDDSEHVKFLKMPEEQLTNGHWVSHGQTRMIGLNEKDNTELQDARAFKKTFTHPVRIIHGSDGIADIINTFTQNGTAKREELFFHLEKVIEQILAQNTGKNIDTIILAIYNKLQEIHLNPDNTPKDDVTLAILNINPNSLT